MNTAVIGAGVSGISAAVAAARAGASVTVYEHKESAANKILITGNGKCNFTNLRMERSCFHSSTDDNDRISSLLRRFGSAECIEFYKSTGLMYRERRGCVYPYTDTAESVKASLLLELKRLDVTMIYDCGMLDVSSDRRINGREYDNIIISCGSMVAPKTGSDGSGYEILKTLGVPVTPLYPALTPLVVKEDLSCLKGLRCEAGIKLIDDKGRVQETSSGELQPYEKGLSGICAMDISSNACRMIGSGKKAFAEVDFFPEMTDEVFIAEIKRRIEAFPGRKSDEILVGLLGKRLINYIIHPVDTRKEDWTEHLCKSLKHHIYELSDNMTKDFSHAQTVSGGVPMTLIDDDCMLIGHKGIFVTGELLDADGICGGYNMHFAWMTGMAAGRKSAS